MTPYFIDTENINGIWPDYVVDKYNQSPDSKFLIFVTEKTSLLSWKNIEKFRKMKSNALEFCEAHNGEKNALDFCLVARLGEEVVRSKKREFVIVSKDKGFDSAITYLAERHSANIIREVSFNAPPSIPINTLHWIESSHAQSFKQNPALRKRLSDTISKHYGEIISM